MERNLHSAVQRTGLSTLERSYEGHTGQALPGGQVSIFQSLFRLGVSIATAQ